MKLIISICALCALTCSSFAAVEITEGGRVLKDGTDIGAVADAAKNGVVTPSEVQAALLAMVAKLNAAHVTEKAAAATAAAATAALAAENVQLLKAASTVEELAAAKALVEKPDLDRKKSALDEEIAKKLAEREALNQAPAKPSVSPAKSAPKSKK